MKFIITIIFSMFLVSCAHHHNAPAHHHHAFEKQCAYSVAHGDVTAKGSLEYKIDHGGKTYYFSTKSKMSEFKKNIDANIKKANKEWSERGGNLR